MNRKPPAGNVRRVKPMGDSLRHTLTSKTGRTIQCESFNEYKLVLCLERDKTVKDYLSQPEVLHYVTKDGKAHRYTPDFKVWRVDDRIEIHAVTVDERANTRARQPKWESAAQQVCEMRGWTFHIHTKQTLPRETELANLQFLFGYRPHGYSNPLVQETLIGWLSVVPKLPLTTLVQRLCAELSLRLSDVIPPILHLLWYQSLSTNMDKLLCLDGTLNPSSQVWLNEGRH